MTVRTSEVDADALRQHFADELERARRRSLGLTTDVLDHDDLMAQHSALMSPLVWDLAHVGNYEELWLLREAHGIAAMRPEIDDLYDAFEHPRAQRPSLPLLKPPEADEYARLVRRKVLDSLETARFTPDQTLSGGGFVYAMVVQHEHQHDETMLATHQLRRGGPVLTDANRAIPGPGKALAPEVKVPGGPFVMGTSSDPWALDNEKPAHRVDLPDFYIDTRPVSNAEYVSFVGAGGYDDPRWWTAEGWQWRCRSGKRTPAFWLRDADGWARRRFGRTESLPGDDPVQHVCWFEADAYARWAGKRLPTEAEWEKAASWDPAAATKRRFPWGDEPFDVHAVDPRANLGQTWLRPVAGGSFPAGESAYGVRQMLGDVWEWTSSDFTAYEGFAAFPYREYSEVFFCPVLTSTAPHNAGARPAAAASPGEYKVLRGGSWATDATVARNTFRNWDLPIRRQIFAGFRCARDAEQA